MNCTAKLSEAKLTFVVSPSFLHSLFLIGPAATTAPNSNEEGYDDEWKQRIATENPENAARCKCRTQAALLSTIHV